MLDPKSDTHLPEQAPSQLDPFKSIVIGAIVNFIISILPLINFICCFSWFFGTYTCVSHFTRRYKVAISKKEGAKLGMLSGMLGGLMSYAFSLFLDMFFSNRVSMDLELLSDIFSQYSQLSEIFAVLQMTMQEVDVFTPTSIIVGLFSTIVVSVILGGIFGAVSASLIKGNEIRR